MLSLSQTSCKFFKICGPQTLGKVDCFYKKDLDGNTNKSKDLKKEDRNYRYKKAGLMKDKY